MSCEKVNDIWLEDELNALDKKALYDHIQQCESCKNEYEIKKAFILTAGDYKKRCEDMTNIKEQPKKQNINSNKRKLLIPLVATFTLTILLFGSIAFGKEAMFSFVNFVTENFGWNLSNTQAGLTYTKDDLKLDTSPISVSKTNISFAFAINSIKNDNLIYKPRDLWIEAGGKIYRPYGFAGASFEKKAGYGEVNFNLTDGLKENLVFKIKDIEIYKIQGDKMSNKAKLVEGVWEIPIQLGRKVIEKANKNYTCYLINQDINNGNTNISFKTLEIEDSKTIITHKIDDKKIKSLGDIKIFGKENNLITERRYNNGKMEYINNVGKSNSIMLYENFPYESSLLPLGDNKPSKILINSFIINENIGVLDINQYLDILKTVNDDNTKYIEREANIEGILFKIKAYRESGVVEISYNTSKVIDSIIRDSNADVKPIETNCTTNGNGVNEYMQKYRLKSGNSKYNLEVFETKEKEVQIPIDLVK